ncbi:MAG: D-aminoacyl-tRNA deacylase [Nanoarchaeota archaeon]
MYKNFLILASRKDPAGVNIVTQLAQFQKDSPQKFFDVVLAENELIYTENINLEKINQYDFIIFASRHVSEKKEKTLSVHAPGNWKKADFGGKPGIVCKTSAIFQKEIMKKLDETAKFFHLRKYNISLECTHHGPLIDKPCIFIEIGSTEEEWKDSKAGFIVAKTIFDVLKDIKENPYNEVAIGIGGPHYCPNFNKIQIKSNVAISHIIPGYSLPLTEEMVKEALDKTEEEVDFALLDWKGIGNSDERKRIIEILDKFYIRHKKVSEIKKGY